MTQVDRLYARDDREVKLPKWAQDKLSQLRMRLGEARQAVSDKLGHYPIENAHILDPNSDFDYVASPHRRVRFQTGPGSREWIELYVDTQRNRLVAMASAYMEVRPSSANVVELKAGTDWK